MILSGEMVLPLETTEELSMLDRDFVTAKERIRTPWKWYFRKFITRWIRKPYYIGAFNHVYIR